MCSSRQIDHEGCRSFTEDVPKFAFDENIGDFGDLQVVPTPTFCSLLEASFFIGNQVREVSEDNDVVRHAVCVLGDAVGRLTHHDVV
jgi:hypothetical protein